MSGKKLHIVRLTPPGRGAVASILLAGPGAEDVFARFWIGPALDPARPVFGRFRLVPMEQVEEIVVHLSGPDEIEIHSHGGEAVVQAIESTLARSGGTATDWTDFFCPVPDDQRELALRLLPLAPTERTARILLDQLNGAWEREKDLIEHLSDPAEKRRRLARLRENAVLGEHLIRPFRVVLAGGVNAGKSCLFNALLGFQRVIVDGTPGTTRDVVSARSALDGFPVEFYDTAGFRATSQELERRGIERSTQTLKDADLVLWVRDATIPPEEQPPIPEGNRTLCCRNKIDLCESAEEERDTISVSAKTGLGLETLIREITARLVPSPPAPLEAVPLKAPSK